MKKILLSICMLLAIGQINAQDNSNTAAAQPANGQADKSEVLSRQLMQDLQLNEHQYVKVKAVHQKRANRLKEIEVKHGNNPAMRDESIKMLDADTDRQLAHILNQNQFRNYLELQGRGQEQLAELPDNYLAEEQPEKEKPARTVTRPHNPQTAKERQIEQRSYEYQE